MAETFRERLRMIMDEKHLKQVDIISMFNDYVQKNNIENCSMSKPLLSSYLHGKFSPNSPRIAVFAKILDVSEAWLIGYDVPRGRPSLDRVEIAVEFEELTDVNKARLMAYLKALKDSQEDQT
ncbi:MAG: hypothetical protein IIY21_02250 [Clostridiales bacterium]|nr:hypothetical protein [Clostridiales bacterium]